MNDQNFIFEQYLKVLNTEAVYAGSQYGIKKAAGAHRRGVTVVDPNEEIASKQNRFIKNLQSDIRGGNLIHVLDLLSDIYGGKEKARKALMKYLQIGNTNVKSQFNPFPEHPNVGPFVIPNFRLPDCISAIKSALNVADKKEDKNLLEILYVKLGEIYSEKYGGDPDDNTELQAVRSFITKFIQRAFRGGGENQVLQQVTFGGESARDDFEQVFITNTKELQGANWDRIKKIAHLLFTGEERFNPDERSSDTYVPERETPENLAGETLADPDRDAHQDRLRAQETTKPVKKKPAKKKPTETKTTKKEPAKKTPAKKKPTDKSSEEKVKKESYQFIKVIKF